MTRYKIIISALWWVSGLTIIAVFLWLTSNPANFGKYGGEALDWLLPQLIPTMTLTGAVAYAQGQAKWTEPPRQVRFAFLLTCTVSVFYILLVIGDIAHALLGTVETERGAVDALNDWNKILSVFQGLAASAIGIFFVKSDPPEKPRGG